MNFSLEVSALKLTGLTSSAAAHIFRLTGLLLNRIVRKVQLRVTRVTPSMQNSCYYTIILCVCVCVGGEAVLCSSPVNLSRSSR